MPTEGDLLPFMPLFAARGRDENWFGLQRAVKEWKVDQSASSSPTAEMLYGISRKLIPNYNWFLFGALCLLFASFTGPIDLRVPLLSAIALISLLVTLFGSVQWDATFRSRLYLYRVYRACVSLPAREPPQIRFYTSAFQRY